MRKKIVAGNWKMNMSLNDGINLAKEVVEELKTNSPAMDVDELGVIMAPPAFLLEQLSNIINSNDRVSVAAQNCATEKSGAYTGEISADMIASTGASYVIIGHSERRSYYQESNDILQLKVKQALNAGLNPIFCIGEVLDEREKDIHFNVVHSQLKESLFDLSAEDFSKIIIAYEPVWAIGTGLTASPEQAQEMHLFIRNKIAENYSSEVAENTTILYGGSCKPSNAKELFANQDVDGGLIGGASLKAKDFVEIVNAF